MVWKPRPRAGAKAGADKPVNEWHIYRRVFRLHALSFGHVHRADEYHDMRAVGLQLLEGWISA